MESENIQQISQIPDVKLYNFTLADAYAKKFQYLDPVVLPAGAFSFHPVTPKTRCT